MNYEFNTQLVNIKFQNDKYKDGFKTRSFRNVKKDATPEGLKLVADALLPLLDGDQVAEIEVVRHEVVDLSAL